MKSSRPEPDPDTGLPATLAGWLPVIWSSGPGKLDSNGEAKGLLDLSSLPVPSKGFGVPFWIAMAAMTA